MSTRLQREKGYRVGGVMPKDRARILELIPLRYLGIGRHQILTDRDYAYKNKIILDVNF